MQRDNVRVVLAGRDVLLITEYTVRLGVFEQPGGFDCTIGRPYSFRYLAERFPPKTKYQLYINDTLIQSGLIDGFTRTGSAKSTRIAIRGRDTLAALADNQANEKISFSESTYLQLTEKVLELSGFNALLQRDFGGSLLESDNEANRKAITGSRTVKSLSKKTTESIQTEIGKDEVTGKKKVQNELKVDTGTKWWSFLVEQYRRVGLFLWSAHDGKLVLSTPDPAQTPLFRFVRTKDESNITADSFSDDTTGRCTEYVVFGRGSGTGKDGTTTVEGRAYDQEMIVRMNPIPEDQADGGKLTIRLTKTDKQVKSNEHATNLARREVAERRRSGWKLSYTTLGHTMPDLVGGGRIIPAPDTVAEVHDDDLGLYGELYNEHVTFIGRGKETFTQFKVLRPEDMFFRAEPIRKLKKSGVNWEPFGPPNFNVSHNGIGSYEDQMAPPIGFDDDWMPPGAVKTDIERDFDSDAPAVKPEPFTNILKGLKGS